jgi:hypothetical protein
MNSTATEIDPYDFDEEGVTVDDGSDYYRFEAARTDAAIQAHYDEFAADHFVIGA